MRHTCSGCSATWTSHRIAHCAAANCHRTFSTTGVFDRHRRDGVCLDPATIPGVHLSASVWRYDSDERSRARLARLGAVFRIDEQVTVGQSGELADDGASAGYS